MKGWQLTCHQNHRSKNGRVKPTFNLRAQPAGKTSWARLAWFIPPLFAASAARGLKMSLIAVDGNVPVSFQASRQTAQLAVLHGSHRFRHSLRISR
jgi:hypothetical protein